MIHTNPTVLVDMPRVHEKAIIRLDTDEVAMLLDHIERCGDHPTGQKKVYYEKRRNVTLRSSLSCSEQVFVFRSVSVWTLKILILRITESR